MPKYTSKNEAHDAFDVYVHHKVLAPAPSTSYSVSDFYEEPDEWQIDPPKTDTNSGNILVFGCDSPTEYLTLLDGSAYDNEAHHQNKCTDYEGSKDSNSCKNCDNNQEPLREECELHTSYEKRNPRNIRKIRSN